MRKICLDLDPDLDWDFWRDPDPGSMNTDPKHCLLQLKQHYSFPETILLARTCRATSFTASVVDPNTLTLDPDSNLGFWPNLDPDPDPGPDPGLFNQFCSKKLKSILEKKKFCNRIPVPYNGVISNNGGNFNHRG